MYVLIPLSVHVGAFVTALPYVCVCPGSSGFGTPSAGILSCAFRIAPHTPQWLPSVFPSVVSVGSSAGSITSWWPVADISSVSLSQQMQVLSSQYSDTRVDVPAFLAPVNPGHRKALVFQLLQYLLTSLHPLLYTNYPLHNQNRIKTYNFPYLPPLMPADNICLDGPLTP